VIAVVTLLYLGVALYLVRQRWRALYGFAEIITGAAIIANTLSAKTPDMIVSGLALVTATYVVVRGCDNVFGGKIYPKA